MPVFDDRHCGAGIPLPVTNVPAARRCRRPSATSSRTAAARQHHRRSRFDGTSAQRRRGRPAAQQGAATTSVARPRSTRTSASAMTLRPAADRPRGSARRPRPASLADRRACWRARRRAALALRLEPSAATDTLVGRGADTFQATERYREQLRRPLGHRARRAASCRNLVLTANLGRLIGLEGCLSGNKPADAGGAGRRAVAVRAARGAQAGPGRLRPGHVRQRVGRRDQRPDPGPDARQGGARPSAPRSAARQRRARRRAGRRPSRTQARRLGPPARVRAVRARPAADQPQVRARPDRAAARRRPELRLGAVLRPLARRRRRRRRASPTCSRQRALRADPGAAEARPHRRRSAREAVALVRAAVRMPRVAAQAATPATRSPARRSWPRTSPTRSRARRCGCCSSALAGDGAGAVPGVPQPRCGCCRWRSRWPRWRSRSGRWRCVGAPLTMASIAVLPVLLGLGVDYAIQYQARVQEAGRPGAGGAHGGAGDRHRGAGHRRRLPRAAAVAGPDGARVRRAARGGHRDRLRAGADRRHRRAVAARRATRALARSLRGAGELLERRSRARSGGRLGPPRGRVGDAVGAARRCGARAACWRSALAVAAVGWAVDSRTEVVSDIERLVPQDLRAVAGPPGAPAGDRRGGRDRRRRRRPRPHRPEVVRWMRDYQSGLLERYGYSAERGCGQRRAVPGAVAARPVPHRASADDREQHPRAARRGAAVLLAAR